MVKEGYQPHYRLFNSYEAEHQNAFDGHSLSLTSEKLHRMIWFST